MATSQSFYTAQGSKGAYNQNFLTRAFWKNAILGFLLNKAKTENRVKSLNKGPLKVT